MKQVKLRDSDAISASLNRPGMIYVNDLSADSICDTADEFLIMNSSYCESHLAGSVKAL
jgi:hypothetical protein